MNKPSLRYDELRRQREAQYEADLKQAAQKRKKAAPAKKPERQKQTPTVKD
jgi:hypothetical protein